MPGEPDARPLLAFPEAARYLGIPPAAVEALVEGGYLQPSSEGDEGPLLPLVDLKAFLARNADGGAGNLTVYDPADADPAALLKALDGRSEEMAHQALEIFSSIFPRASEWSGPDRARFLEQAKGRFEAILAITGQDSELDEALEEHLWEVGAAAVREGAPFPELLLVLRISRDLVVQTAVELAEEGGRHWGTALSLVLTRVLPAMDGLTDALAQGYWTAVIGRQKESRARYEHVVEHSSDGIYDLDLEGRIRYANPSLGLIVGRRRVDELEGSRLGEVLSPAGAGSSAGILTHPSSGARRVELEILRPDGVRRVLDVRTMPRVVDEEVVGFQGVVRDVTASHDLEAEKREFVSRLTKDLRAPLAAIGDLSRVLESEPAPSGQGVHDAVRALRTHVERIAGLADDLYDVSRLEAESSAVTPSPVELAAVIRVALEEVGEVGEVGAGSGRVEVEAPDGIRVMADDRGLARVLANLVRNGLEHGRPPVSLSVEGVDAGFLELAVVDQGQGVPDDLVSTLFSRVHMLARSDQDRSRGRGVGLSVARGLVEAMGGRLWYERSPGGGACFRLTVPVPNRRRGDKPIRL